MMWLKRLFKAFLHRLLAPVRWWMHRGKHAGAGRTKAAVREIPNDILLGEVRRTLQEGHTATIVVKGYSMRPFLEHCRDKVILKAVAEPQLGDAVLAEITPGRFVLHRVIRREGRKLTLMGDGNLQGVEHCTVDDVAGKVVTYVYPFGQLSAGDARLCRRIRMWKRCLPIRRCLLFIYRMLNE